MDELGRPERLELDALGEEYLRRHGVAIEFVKADVGSGDAYENAVSRAVVSENGAWFECVDLPLEFTGASGCPVRTRFMADVEALAVLRNLKALEDTILCGESGDLSLLALYTPAGIADGRGVYVYHCRKDGGPAAVIGQFDANVLPLAYRCRFDVPDTPGGLISRRGVVFCLTGVGERNLVVEIDYDAGEHLDLGRVPVGDIAQ